MATKQIDEKWLKGLKYRTAKREKVEAEGAEKKYRNVPVIEPLTPDKVLAWNDRGTEIVIVSADGKKHIVSKKAAQAEKQAEK